MCTSFIKKTTDNFYIGMNFDNNGMNFSINTKYKDWFIVFIDAQKNKFPSFGIHKSGVFFNNLLVESNGKGGYRRSSQLTHTTKFLKEIIDGKVNVENLNDFLAQTEIVNVPGWSTHNMITTPLGNVWVIELGRGNLYVELKPGESQILTNVSLIDAGDPEIIRCQRYNKAKELLENENLFGVAEAFKVLEEVKQNDGDWITDFSMVFDKNARVVYYTENQDFQKIDKYIFC